MKHVMMIGGGVQQVKAVELAQSWGYRVIVTDRLTDAPCRKIADEFHVVDGRDTERLVALALRLKERGALDGVFTLTELVTSVAAVSTAAGIPGASLEGAVCCQDKGLAKSRWRVHGVSTPDGRRVETQDEARAWLRDARGTAVIKPVTGFGGKGVAFLEGEDDLDRFFGKERGGGPWVMEERIEGSMHDVNGLLDAGGTFHPLGVVDRFFMEDQPVEKEIRYPSALSKAQQRELYELLEQGVRAFGIDRGPVKADAVLEGDRFRLLEVATRLHGPKNSIYLLPFAGEDILRPTLAALTGGEVPARDVWRRESRCAIGRAVLPEPGEIVALQGVEETRSMEGVEELMILRGEGDTIAPYRDAAGVPAYVFVSGSDFERCEEIMEQAMHTLSYETR